MSDLILRPRSATELIDAAFQVYRRTPVPFMVGVALVYVPWLAIRLVFSLNVPETPDPTSPAIWKLFAVTFGAGVVLYDVAGGVTACIARSAYLGEPIDIGAAFRQTLSRLPQLIVATLIAFLAITVGVIFVIVPGIYLVAMLFGIRQIIVLEGTGSFAALGRSASLSKGQKLHILGTLILVALLTTVVNLGLVWLFSVQPSKVVANVLATAATIVVYPIFAITETLLYFDTRIRNEGFDVEYLAGAVTETAPAAGPTA